MPTSVHSFTAAVMRNTLYVCGTQLRGHLTAAQLWVLAADREWHVLAPPPSILIGHTMVGLDGQLWCIGSEQRNSCGGGSAAARAVWVYNVVLDKWDREAPMSKPRTQPAATVVGSELWAIGGECQLSAEKLTLCCSQKRQTRRRKQRHKQKCEIQPKWHVWQQLEDLDSRAVAVVLQHATWQLPD